MKKIMVIFGTRPEVIKMAPVVFALKSTEKFRVITCATSQHRSMQDQMVAIFKLAIDYDLNLMRENQSLNYICSMGIQKIDEILEKEKPDMILVQGDTTTAMAMAIAAANRKIAIGHVEAGLRTWDLQAPFPEEINRQVIGRVATMHFAPTQQAKENLLKENIMKDRVFVTGNTVIDALLWMKRHLEEKTVVGYLSDDVKNLIQERRHYVLITGHRRENFGCGFENICEAISKLSKKYIDVSFVYPVHLNPSVKDIVEGKLSTLSNVFLLPPVEYPVFVYLLMHCYLVLTDSGGVQEEAPALGKPVLVMRQKTERSEGVEAGVAKLVGSNVDSIISNVSKLLDSKFDYEAMVKSSNPYGNGNASVRIFTEISNYMFFGEKISSKFVF